MRADVLDDRVCELGEGPLWHPEREQLFWFDILGNRLLSRVGGEPLEWRFDEHHSTAGWIDRDRLLLASETGLWTFDIETGVRHLVCPLEADDPGTRSNDGRADPFGGFWIGTMGKRAEPGRGAIYRYYKGELRKLFPGISIPNSICLSPDGQVAYFADTPSRKIMRQPLDAAGWPSGAAEVFVDLAGEPGAPDGSVVDAEGALWNAQWGAGGVARYLPDGRQVAFVETAGRHSSCPAFGGPDLTRLFVTTAREGITDPDDRQGLLYACDTGQKGQAEHPVVLAHP
ncbi:MAG: SMP-30/gluconolactonase/LRE family protein [Pseudooceanicola sp.]